MRRMTSMGMLVILTSCAAVMDSCSWKGKMIVARTGDTENVCTVVPISSSTSTAPSAGSNESFLGAFAI